MKKIHQVQAAQQSQTKHDDCYLNDSGRSVISTSEGLGRRLLHSYYVHYLILSMNHLPIIILVCCDHPGHLVYMVHHGIQNFWVQL